MVTVVNVPVLVTMTLDFYLKLWCCATALLLLGEGVRALMMLFVLLAIVLLFLVKVMLLLLMPLLMTVLLLGLVVVRLMELPVLLLQLSCYCSCRTSASFFAP